LKHKFRQLAHISDGTTTFLTNIEAGEVTEVLHWSSEGYIYYIATLDGNPGSRFFYRILSPTESKSRNVQAMPECLSCKNNTQEMEFLRREECLYAEVKMSLNGSFFTMVTTQTQSSSLGSVDMTNCEWHTNKLNLLFQSYICKFTK